MAGIVRAKLACHTLSNEEIEGSAVILELAEGSTQFEVPGDYVIPQGTAYMRLDMLDENGQTVDTKLQSVPLDPEAG